MIKMIFAVAAYKKDFYPFGLNGGLPWPKNEEDMKFFREYTSNHILVCGSNTYNSMPKSVFKTLGRSYAPASKTLPKDCIIIGGKQVIMNMWRECDEIVVNFIHTDVKDYDIDIPKLLFESFDKHFDSKYIKMLTPTITQIIWSKQ